MGASRPNSSPHGALVRNSECKEETGSLRSLVGLLVNKTFLRKYIEEIVASAPLHSAEGYAIHSELIEWVTRYARFAAPTAAPNPRTNFNPSPSNDYEYQPKCRNASHSRYTEYNEMQEKSINRVSGGAILLYVGSKKTWREY